MSNPARSITPTDASYAYDAANRVIATTDGLGATRTLGYDLRDDAISVTDARGNVTTLGYDIYKRPDARADPDAGAYPYEYLYHYDRIDNLNGANSPSRKDGYSTSTVIGYDALSRVTNDMFSNYSYDAASNLLSASGQYSVGYAYTYDQLNRRVSATSPPAFPTPVTFSYAYDALSRRTGLSDTLGGTTLYAYDGEDRLTSLTTPWGGVITQSYDTAGRPLRLAYPNGLDADLSFEANTGRLASINHRVGTLAAPIAQYNHSYDIRGNLATLQELTGTKNYNYDPIERLTGVTQTLPAPATQVESYAYDTEGNRVASQISAAYVTDPANHVLSDAINTYTWSTDGDLTSRTPKNGGVGYNFSSTFVGVANQMRLDNIAGSDGSAISFYYDPFQRLVSRHWPAPRGDDALYYDGPDVVLELRYPSAGGSQWVRYVHGPGADQPLATEVYPLGAAPTPGAGSQYYYHADGEGSIRLLTDVNGQIANRYDYDSYGQRLSVIESLPLQPYGWKGREWIPGPNIYYNRARFYDPVLGRFMSQDPLGYGGRRFQSLQLRLEQSEELE